LKRELKRRGEIEGQEKTRRRSSKIGAETDIAIIPSMAEKANAFSADDNKTCSDGESRMNEYSDSEGTRTEDRGTS